MLETSSHTVSLLALKIKTTVSICSFGDRGKFPLRDTAVENHGSFIHPKEIFSPPR